MLTAFALNDPPEKISKQITKYLEKNYRIPNLFRKIERDYRWQNIFKERIEPLLKINNNKLKV